MRITVRLSGEVAARLEALKRASGKTTTAIVREALRDKLLFADVREKGQPAGSLPAPDAPPRAVASAMVSDGPPGGQEAPQKLPDLPEELRGQVASLRAYGAAALDEARTGSRRLPCCSGWPPVTARAGCRASFTCTCWSCCAATGSCDELAEPRRASDRPVASFSAQFPLAGRAVPEGQSGRCAGTVREGPNCGGGHRASAALVAAGAGVLPGGAGGHPASSALGAPDLAGVPALPAHRRLPLCAAAHAAAGGTAVPAVLGTGLCGPAAFPEPVLPAGAGAAGARQPFAAPAPEAGPGGWVRRSPSGGAAAGGDRAKPAGS